MESRDKLQELVAPDYLDLGRVEEEMGKCGERLELPLVALS
jgi:hypothetical protein